MTKTEKVGRLGRPLGGMSVKKKLVTVLQKYEG